MAMTTTTITGLPLELRQQIFYFTLPHPLTTVAHNKTWHAIPMDLNLTRTPSSCPPHSCLPSATAVRSFILAIENLLLVSRNVAADLPGVIDKLTRELLEYRATIPETQMHVASLYPFREHIFKLAGRREAVRAWDVSVVIRKLVVLRQRVERIACVLSGLDLESWEDSMPGCKELGLLGILPEVRA